LFEGQPEKDVFGNSLFLKKTLIRVLGLFSHRRYRGFNELQIEGSEIIRDLPDNNVLFVANHQTYFADVIFIQHVIHAALNGRPNTIFYPGFFIRPKTNIYFVAAEETMKSGILPRIMMAGGAITVKRTWREKGKDTKRNVDFNDISKVLTALGDGWVISFPQGTTSPYSPGRKGTAHIIKQTKATVVPIVIDGFRRAFDKKGLKTKKRGVELRMTIKPPMDIDYDADPEVIINQVMAAIEQDEPQLKAK
jgi:1-acyl-sn-glycerol-3-phosphate acyltransferase